MWIAPAPAMVAPAAMTPAEATLREMPAADTGGVEGETTELATQAEADEADPAGHGGDVGRVVHRGVAHRRDGVDDLDAHVGGGVADVVEHVTDVVPEAWAGRRGLGHAVERGRRAVPGHGELGPCASEDLPGGLTPGVAGVGCWDRRQLARRLLLGL